MLIDELKKNPFILAPMAGITDCAFRSYMREMGAGIVITELVSAVGLKYSSERTRKLMRFDAIQHPVGIQLFGEDLEALSYAAKEVEQMGADFVDLNFGCPVPKVVKRGAGSAALKDLLFLRDVLRAVKSAVQIPVTIKVRTGWDAHSRNTHEVAQIAFDEGISWVAIHGRTRAQGYSGHSDWDYISEVKAKARLPIVGNGDIATGEQALARLKGSGCDAIMIGRGCLKNPWIFQEAMGVWMGKNDGSIKKDFLGAFDRLREHLERTSEQRLVSLQIKKLASWYSAGYPGSATFRKTVFSLADTADVMATVTDYFSNAANFNQADTSHEPFLMGGHG